jgi:hypothetical protein
VNSILDVLHRIRVNVLGVHHPACAHPGRSPYRKPSGPRAISATDDPALMPSRSITR